MAQAEQFWLTTISFLKYSSEYNMFRVCPAYGLVIPFCAISSVQFETDTTNLMILGRKMPFQ